MQLNVEHLHEGDVVANMKRSPRVKYITYFEDSANLPGKKTAVWELDKGIGFITILNSMKDPSYVLRSFMLITLIKSRQGSLSVSVIKRSNMMYISNSSNYQ